MQCFPGCAGGRAILPLTGEERAEERLRAEQAETLLEHERLRAERLASDLDTWF